MNLNPAVLSELLHRIDKETDMPYRTIADLPKAQTDQYTEHQKKAFLEAFNSAYEKYKDDEGHAFAIAHAAAKKAGKNPGRAAH